MQLSISNIAWDITQDEAIADLLLSEGVHCIDIAPGKYFSNLSGVTSEDISRVKYFWENRGIKIVGMQSLFFGTKGLNLFDESSQPAMLKHLNTVRKIAVGLGVARLTFGSPKNRDRTNLSDTEADKLATSFFQNWTNVNNLSSDPKLLIEPNPTIYGTNFLTTTREATNFIRKLANPCVGLQLDLGTMTANKEPSELIDYAAPFIGHIHVSEPWLVPVGTTDAPHAKYAQQLKRVQGKYLTIEMIVKKTDNQLSTVCNAIRFVKRVYGDLLS